MKQYVFAQNDKGIRDLHSEELSKHDAAETSDNVTPIGSDHELALLNMRLSELEASLEKAQRRIERLLGERNQLAALLDKRDDQIQRLFRDLASDRKTTPTQASPRSSSSSLRQLLSMLTKKISSGHSSANARRNSTKPGKPSTDETQTPIHQDFKRPPLVANYKKAAPKAVLAVVVFGLSESEIKNLLPVIERDSRASDMMPLLLTDNDAFEVLRENSIIFEYLPPAEDRQHFDRGLSWDLYVQRRLAIIRKKWQPARVIALGQVAAETLSLWQQSPFEEIPLPAAVKDQSQATT